MLCGDIFQIDKRSDGNILSCEAHNGADTGSRAQVHIKKLFCFLQIFESRELKFSFWPPGWCSLPKEEKPKCFKVKLCVFVFTFSIFNLLLKRAMREGASNVLIFSKRRKMIKVLYFKKTTVSISVLSPPLVKISHAGQGID